MRKKLDTRFPASRIKKIMQADEDVGKIAMAVPLLVSKALELFLQDLCDRTYDITLQRGAKTLSSFHLKQCVQSFNVFDFLKDVVNKVPDLGGFDAAGEDRSVAKRRKAIDDEGNDIDDGAKRSRMHDPGHNTNSGRGQGRGRGRGCGRGSRTIERETAQLGKCQDNLDMSPTSDPPGLDNGTEAKESNQSMSVGCSTNSFTPNFDLNEDLHANRDTAVTPPAVVTSSTDLPEMKREEYSVWPLSDIDKVTIDPLQLAHLNRSLDEDDEDYDEEG